MSNIIASTKASAQITWPSSDFSRTPYEVFVNEDLFIEEQEKVFRGPVWNYLGLECEVPAPGDFITCYVGSTPVVLSRSMENQLHAFVNRCTHRGAPIVREQRGNAKNHRCIYHHWTYNCSGDLIGVPFERGFRGVGGYPDDFQKENHNPEKMRVEVIAGVVFGTFSEEVAPLETYLGPFITERLKSLFHKPLKVVGYQRHPVRANWKLFAENTRDGYHGPLLHPFTADGIFEPTNRGMVEVTDDGLSCLISSYIDKTAAPVERKANPAAGFKLEDPSIMDPKPREDGLATSVVSIFPNTLFTLVHTMSVRQIRPKSAGVMELAYTYFTYEDDDQEALETRAKQANMWGPSGYIAVEDTEVVEQIQARVVKDGASSLMRMGINDPNDRSIMISEGAVRTFWSGYCKMMGIPVPAANDR